MAPSKETKVERAIRLCKDAGFNPFGFLDYSDLRKGKQNYKYYLEE